MNWRLFLSTYCLIVIAEIPGKTTFASALLSARARPLPVFLGSSIAFVLHSMIAVLAGRLISLLPAQMVQIGVGFIFLAVAATLWREKPDGPTENQVSRADGDFRKIVATAFSVIFLAQWGDPTQLATAALAAKYQAPWTIMVSATAGLWTVSGGAVVAGHFAREKIHPVVIQRIAAVVFAGIGLFLLVHTLGHS